MDRSHHAMPRPGSPRDAALHGAACRGVVGVAVVVWYHARSMSHVRAKVRAIDPTTLPKHFDSAAAETRWHAHWDAADVYGWDASRPREETFVVDTPPPTASGSLHVGHVFSYTQADVIARYRRMRGDNVFYPM